MNWIGVACARSLYRNPATVSRAAIRAWPPALLARPAKAPREALELGTDTALCSFETSSDWRTVGMLYGEQMGEWKMVRIQVRICNRLTLHF
jgi:hypothetical protein